jgi:spore coat polysaccharide biosynthesis predicted glycosyltransferase SpsG/ribosomal protein S18 acetylase RimI-like enzyme
MNVFILTEGGKDIGIGHITRCVSIYQAFEEVGIRPELVVKGDETVRDLLKDKNSRVFDWLDDQERLFAAVRNADIVFIDSYLADYDLYEKISNIAGTGVYFDDSIRVDYPKGFVVNGAIFAERMPYPEKNGVRYLLDTQYTPLRKEFWDVPEKSVRDILKTAMITFGGADIHNLTPKVLKILVDTYLRLFKKVIIGSSFQNIAEIERLKGDNTELIYYPDATGMKKVMLESDIAISAGGQTLYELARIGVPTIAVAVTDNQSTNIRGWQESGFAEGAEDEADEELAGRIYQKIELLKDNNTRQCKSKVGRKIIDGAGSSRIVKEVLSDFHSRQLILRKATQVDAEDLFDLANEKTVRQNSFSHGKIKWADHTRWLNEKLGNGSCLFLIVVRSGKFVGQVRFEMTHAKEEAVISISLKRSMRGFGLSSLVINESMEKLVKVYKDVHLVRAYVKDENIASMRAFEKAGFKFLENTIVKGCKGMVYERVISDG